MERPIYEIKDDGLNDEISFQLLLYSYIYAIKLFAAHIYKKYTLFFVFGYIFIQNYIVNSKLYLCLTIFKTNCLSDGFESNKHFIDHSQHNISTNYCLFIIFIY